MNEDNVVDISDRDKFMARIVEDDAVQFVQIGTSGTNQVLTLSKNALIAIREGKSFPVELLVGDKKVKFQIMRDTTFKRQLAVYKKAAETAQDMGEAQVEANNEVAKIGKDIGNKPIITE